tara:strand:- start:1079 stop:2188 length:1110 start_codon:yes stop_codon:yes gene_type:complete
LKYYIIAGEASGDLHGSNLIKALFKKDPQAEIRAWGGDLMQAQGAHLVKHYRDLAFMGFVEVLLNLRTILRNLRFCKADIDNYKPDVLVLIDYPGFNMRIAEYARQKGMKVVYYISPQIWAWKQSRVHKIKRDVGLMLTILPFEQEFYRRFDMEVSFVGHPLLDAIQNRPEFDVNERRASLGLSEAPLIALLPGSRKQEIRAMLPLMIKTVESMGLNWVVAGAPSQDLSFYEEVSTRKNLPIIFGQTYEILEIADAALVTSGTATLETALFEVPEVVCHKGSRISYEIAKRLVKIDFISLVNLVMNREVVTELIQHDFREDRLKAELQNCLREDTRSAILADYKELKEKLGGAGASERAAEEVVEYASA